MRDLSGLIRSIQQRLGALERQQVRYRQGIVTSARPLRVALGGSDVDTPAGSANGARPRPGDTVAVLTWGQAALVLGVLGWSPSWTSLSFASGWAEQATRTTHAAYAISADGTVRMRGWAERAAAWTLPTTICTLPVGPAESGRWIVPINVGGVDGWGHIRVMPNGTVELAASSIAWASTALVGLWPVSFWSES